MNLARLFSMSVALLTILLCVGACRAGADVMIRERAVTMPTKVGDIEIAGTEDTVTIWLAHDRARKDRGDMSFIYNSKTRLVYTLFHKSKTYTVVTPEGVEVDDQGKSPYGTLSEGLTAMRKPPALKVVKTDSTIMRNGFLCRKYVLEENLDVPTVTGKTCADLWATEEITLDLGLYRAIKSANTRGLEYGGAEDSSMKRIRGFPVLLLSVSTGTSDDYGTMTIEGREELLEFKEVKTPAGHFDVPRDYKLQHGATSGK